MSYSLLQERRHAKKRESSTRGKWLLYEIVSRVLFFSSGIITHEAPLPLIFLPLPLSLLPSFLLDTHTHKYVCMYACIHVRLPNTRLCNRNKAMRYRGNYRMQRLRSSLLASPLAEPRYCEVSQEIYVGHASTPNRARGQKHVSVLTLQRSYHVDRISLVASHVTINQTYKRINGNNSFCRTPTNFL